MKKLLTKKIQLLKPLQPIFLLSHMRSYSSVLGHIIGNNPEINGYYEMHIGYYSWKSLVRQKLKYLEHHTFKAGSRYIFDKVLHNEHYVSCELFNKKTQVIISLREPNETIPSIIKLFKKSNPSHECTTEVGAIDYYKKRIIQLEKYSESLKNNYIYLDANSIKNNTSKVFLFLEKNLTLKYPLSREYKIQEMTGLAKSGDSSKALKQGKLIEKNDKKNAIKIDESRVMQELNELYLKVRKNIIKNSQNYLS